MVPASGSVAATVITAVLFSPTLAVVAEVKLGGWFTSVSVTLKVRSVVSEPSEARTITS